MTARRDEARRIRVAAAELAATRPHPEQTPNGEERRWRRANGSRSYAACFTKGLPHDADGLVDGAAYRALLAALETGAPAAFADLPSGAAPGESPRRFLDPTAGLAFDLAGPDPQSFALAPAPTLDSAEAAAELAELYWMAMLRDLPFAAFAAGEPRVEAAVAQLNSFYAFSGTAPVGPGRVRARLAPETLFRGVLPGDRDGPFLSQLLWPAGNAAADAEGRVRAPRAGVDFGADWPAWLRLQNGARAGDRGGAGRARLLLTPRDLAAYTADAEAPIRASLHAARRLLALEEGGWLDPEMPLRAHPRIEAGALYGGAHLRALLAEAGLRAMRAAAFQKWYVHRRLRPEAMAGLAELNRRIAAGQSAAAPIDLHPQLAACGVLDAVARHRPRGETRPEQGAWLLPLADPEGSPMSPAYGGAHAAVAGACVTVLKAFFDEGRRFAALAEPDPEGRRLVARDNAEGLTVGGELNKLASNLALGRGFAGVNFFSDYTEGLWLGENVALGLMREQKLAHNETYRLTLTPFFGTEPVTV